MSKKKKSELTLMVKPEVNRGYDEWPFQWAEKWEVKHLQKFGWKESKKLKDTIKEIDNE